MGPNITTMLELMLKAEKYQDHIEEYETGSLKRIVVKREEGTLQGASGEELDDIYHVARDLEDNFWYQRAITKRNSYIARATMYGIAALNLRETAVDPKPTCSCYVSTNADGAHQLFRNPECPVHGGKP